MYQNAPPQAYNNMMNGGPHQGPPPQQQQQFGGYPTLPNQQFGGNTKLAYQQPAVQVAPNSAPSAAVNNNNGGGGAVSSGLIRLTLRKPMGIVFEPTPDPHNPSQQRGVRICDLPRTGAAFLSGKLQVGDELLSINDKTMSRSTFDEIMDFIITADKDRVDLLFRRPTKEKSQNHHQQQQQMMASPDRGEGSTPTAALGPSQSANSVKWVDDGHGQRAKIKTASGGGRRENLKDDDEDVEEPRRGGKGGGSSKRRDERDEVSKRRDDRDEVSVGDDTYDQYTVESQSQYTMETYEDERKGWRGGRGGGTRRGGERDRSKRDPLESSGFLDLLIDTLCTSVIGRKRGGKGKYDDYDDDQTYDDQTYDDGTYETYEDNGRRRRKDDETYATEDDGTLDQTLETNDESYVDRRKERIKQHLRAHQSMEKKQQINPSNSKSEATSDETSGVASYPPKKVESPPAPDPPTIKQKDEESQSAVDTLHVPLRELNFDEHQDYAADVSVMESLGGPSLIVERARLQHATMTGAGHAAKFDNIEKHDPELAKLVAMHGDGFECEPGMSKEETAFSDPYAFYEHAVTVLLRNNEPEKVRLLSKLMAKYKGRERHLIHKLSARYKKENNELAGGVNVETKTSGMEKIHEGEEDAGSLNDPSRANVKAIEDAKKKMESVDNWGDGWPPAISDPWGGANEKAAADSKLENAKISDAPAGDDSRPLDEEDSYSDASSYTGDSGLDGTSPAVIAQVSELLNYVYGKTSVAGQIDRVSTIMRAYEGREAVLLELLETKALIKANADTSSDSSGIPMSLRENPGLNGVVGTPNVTEKTAPQTPVSALTATTGANNSKKSPLNTSTPNTIKSPQNLISPSEASVSPDKKKKKGMFGGIFGSSKKKEKKGNFPTPAVSKKGQQLIDDGSI